MNWETEGDVAASPYPPSAEVTVQGEISPHKRKDAAPTEADYVIYNRCPIFTTPDDQPTMSHSSRHRVGAKHRRVGAVPKIWSNFYNRGLVVKADDLEEDANIRFVGVSQDGQHNGKDAKDFPESAGRLAVMVQGAVSMVVDERYLTNPCFGDFLEWIPEDSGLRLAGTKHYGLPIIRNIKPSTVNQNQTHAGEPGDTFKNDTLKNARAGLFKTGSNAGEYAKPNLNRIIGVLLEHTPRTNEVRVLLRPHVPLKA